MEFNPSSEAALLLQEQFIDSTSLDVISAAKNHSAETPSNQSPDPPTHKASLSLDRVGVSQDPIGPRRRARRGPTPRTPQQQARSVARRNARERKRVRLVNLGFATLRDHIPPHFGVTTATAPSTKSKTSGSRSNNSNSNSSNNNNNNSKKLSKVETLRCAIEYIKQLREAIGFDDKDSTGASTEGFSSSSSPPEFSSSPSYCTTPSPVMMLMSASRSPPMFHDDADDFLDIMDWTTL